MGHPNKFYFNGVMYAPWSLSSRSSYPEGEGEWTYGTTTPMVNTIKVTSSNVTGVGYITFFTDTLGCHGDNLNTLEENDPDLHICATKMAYDRPNKAQEIGLRVLNSSWDDTTDKYYTRKYDIGSLPNAVLDVRERLMSIVTSGNNYGRFNGRYYYER